MNTINWGLIFFGICLLLCVAIPTWRLGPEFLAWLNERTKSRRLANEKREEELRCIRANHQASVDAAGAELAQRQAEAEAAKKVSESTHQDRIAAVKQLMIENIRAEEQQDRAKRLMDTLIAQYTEINRQRNHYGGNMPSFADYCQLAQRTALPATGPRKV